MSVKIKDGKLVVVSNTKCNIEELVNRQRAIIRTLQQRYLDADNSETYFLLEQLDDMLIEPDQVLVEV